MKTDTSGKILSIHKLQHFEILIPNHSSTTENNEKGFLIITHFWGVNYCINSFEKAFVSFFLWE